MSTRCFSVNGRSFVVAGVSDTDRYFNAIEGRFEARFQDFCRLFLAEDAVALDVGANIGVTSLILSERLRSGRVFAFEPGETVFQLLQENLKNNAVSNVDAYHQAVSDKTQRVRFLENSAFGYIEPDGESDSVSASDIEGFALDDLVGRLGLERLDFIKVDIEGHEPQFFDGATATLARFNPVVYFELNSWCLISQSRNHPLDFMRRITSQFEFVYRVNKSESEAVLLERMDADPVKAAMKLVHDNMACFNSVNDIVVTNNPHALHPGVVSLMTKCGDLQQTLDLAKQENEDLRRQLEAGSMEREKMAGLLKASRRELDALRQQIGETLKSRLWKYTKTYKALRKLGTRKP